MKNSTHLFVIIMIMSINTYAVENTVPVETTIEIAPQTQSIDLLKTVDGYIRVGYQTDDKHHTDLALGGKLHVETDTWHGLLAGASFYTTHAQGEHDGAGMIFFDSNNESYDILGEAYIQSEFGHTTLKAGRQEIDTPYADTDDNGIVPNTFEAYILTNTDISDTTLIVAYIHKMAGIDASVPEKFTNTDMHGGITTVGMLYEGIENLALQGWYYDIKDSFSDREFTYFDITYTGAVSNIAYEIAAQYATQDAFEGDASGDANIFGLAGALSFESTGISIGATYNSTNGTAASNGFGGGPFYTSSEHLTLVEAGINGDALYFSAEWDAQIASLDGLTLSAGYLTLKDSNHVKSTELDLVANYVFNDNLRLDVIYSNVKDKINTDDFQNTRVFMNYTF